MKFCHLNTACKRNVAIWLWYEHAGVFRKIADDKQGIPCCDECKKEIERRYEQIQREESNN